VGGPIEMKTVVSGKKATRTGRTYFSNWQSAIECERGAAQVMLGFGSGYRVFMVQVFGEDGVAQVDIYRGGVRMHEATPIRREAVAITADAFENAGRIVGSAVRSLSSTLVGHLRGGGASPPHTTASIAEFYAALSAGRTPPSGLAEGTDVVDFMQRIPAQQMAATKEERKLHVSG
jgi:hypothetical protein